MILYYQFLKVFFGARTVDGTICIGYTSLGKYMPKYIKPISNRYNITCGYETYIIAMLLQSDLNKWRISQVDKLDKFYMNSASTIILKRPKNYFISYKNKIFPNNSHIHLRACDAVSSYHCPYPITVSDIAIWECILNCCSDCPMANASYLVTL